MATPAVIELPGAKSAGGLPSPEPLRQCYTINIENKRLDGKEVNRMIIDLEKRERDLLVHELEETTIPQIRELVASGMRKNSRDELKMDEEVLKNVLDKLKKAA